MMKRLTGLIESASAALLAKVVVGVVAAGVTALLGVWLWINVLQVQIENKQNRIDELHEKAGRMDVAIRGLELDNSRLVASLKRQTEAVQRLAVEANAARKQAADRAKTIAALQTPAAGEGAAAMQEWWDEHVLR